LAQGKDQAVSRDKALVQAAEEYPELRDRLKKIRSLRDYPFSSNPVSTEAILDTYLCLARQALAAKPGGPRFRRWLRIPALSLESLKIFLPGDALGKIHKAVAALAEVQRAVFVPRLSFDAVAVAGMDLPALAGATIDAFDLVLIGPRLPAVDKLRRFNAALDCYRPMVNPFFGDTELAVALRPTQGWTIKAPDQDPEFFACLRSAKPLDGRLEISGAVEVERPFLLVDHLEERARTLLALFRQPEAFRLPSRSFLSLFWEAGRAAWLVAQTGQPPIRVPVSSEQVLQALAALTPGAEPILSKIYHEYCCEVQRQSSEAVRYTQWIERYALRLEELLFPSGIGSPELPSQGRTELTISVMLITRNRAGLLRTALKSLSEQERPPDQVVVVDNASSDDTPAVVRAFADRLNLTLVREETIGIPFARNTALKHCIGDVVAVMDDDCVAAPQWLKELEIPFLKDPHIGAVGGSIIPLEGQRDLVARFYASRMSSPPGGERKSSP
jgi:iron-sulfur cluster repair protein YtfE (RIC family)